MRCSGSSFACAALGCDRAGDVNQLCMGAVMGRSALRNFWEAVAAEAVASAGVRRAGFGVLVGMGGYTTTTVSSISMEVWQWVMVSMPIECLPESDSSYMPLTARHISNSIFLSVAANADKKQPPPSERIPRPPYWSAELSQPYKNFPRDSETRPVMGPVWTSYAAHRTFSYTMNMVTPCRPFSSRGFRSRTTNKPARYPDASSWPRMTHHNFY